MNKFTNADLESKLKDTRAAIKCDLSKLCRRKKETDKLSKSSMDAKLEEPRGECDHFGSEP